MKSSMFRDPRFNSGSYVAQREAMRSLRDMKNREELERQEMDRRAMEERWNTRRRLKIIE